MQIAATINATIGRPAPTVPIAATYPLTEVREAYRDLMRRHARGKIVLIPQ